jgi:ABC-2 type transport system ATP-binding protein
MVTGNPVLSINNISKTYGAVRALHQVSFNIPQGSVFGVLGPNGSGKTTLLGILLQVLNADSGSYSWLGGMPPEAARKKIGSLLETPNFYHYLSATDNLKITATIRGYGGDDAERVLKLVGLFDRRDSKFQTYSLGMKQRLAIGAALLGRPGILVLDEPTNGLDPAGIAEIRALINQLHTEGHTIIIASHLLDEVEKVCTHMAILKKGELLTTGTVAGLLHSEKMIEISAQDINALTQCITHMPGVQNVLNAGNLLQVYCTGNVEPADINKWCMQQGIVLTQLVLKKRSLESKFMELTN